MSDHYKRKADRIVPKLRYRATHGQHAGTPVEAEAANLIHALLAGRDVLQARVKELEEEVSRLTMRVVEVGVSRMELVGVELHAEVERYKKALEAIKQYNEDTLSGRADGPEDATWYQAGIAHVAGIARTALAAVSGGKKQHATDPTQAPE